MQEERCFWMHSNVINVVKGVFTVVGSCFPPVNYRAEIGDVDIVGVQFFELIHCILRLRQIMQRTGLAAERGVPAMIVAPVEFVLTGIPRLDIGSQIIAAAEQCVIVPSGS